MPLTTSRIGSVEELEQALFGAMLYTAASPDVEGTALVEMAAAMVEPEDLSNHMHQQTWRAFRAIIERGDVLNPISVYEEASLHGFGDEVIDAEHLGGWMMFHYLDAHAVPQAKLVKRASLARQIDEATGRGEFGDVHRLSREMESLNGNAGDDIPTMAELVESYWETMDVESERVTHWGIPGLDRITGGMLPGQLIVVGGRTGIGKSAFVLSVAYHNVVRGRSVGFISLEMDEHEILQRMLAIRTGLSTLKVRTLKGASDSETAAVTEGMAQINELPLSIKRTTNNLDDVLATARRMRDKDNIELLVIDYLQLMRMGRRSSNRVEELEAITGAMKSLAHELDVPVLTPAQLNRDTEEKAPKLADFRSSGSIEQDADIALLLSIDEDGANGVSDRMNCVIAKHRNGPLGMVNLRRMLKTTQVVEESHDGLD